MWNKSCDEIIKNPKVICKAKLDYEAFLPSCQSESLALRYMNRYAIDEEDQFEIAAVLTLDALETFENETNKFDESSNLFKLVNSDNSVRNKSILVREKLDKAMQALQSLTKQQKQGLDLFWVFKRSWLYCIYNADHIASFSLRWLSKYPLWRFQREHE